VPVQDSPTRRSGEAGALRGVEAGYCRNEGAWGLAEGRLPDEKQDGHQRPVSYNLYGFVTLVVETADHGYKRYFDNEYRRLGELAPPGAAPTTITVHIVDALPGEKPGDIRREVVFKKLFRHAYVVRGLQTSDVHLYFRRHPVGALYATAVGVFLQAQVLEPILYLKLLEQEVLLIHAAGVADDRHGYVFPAHGGTGKTTLSLNLLRNGFNLLGDDLLLLDPATQTVYAYPRPLHLFTYNIDTLADANVPVKVRAAIRFKNVLRFLLERSTGQQFLISTRVHVDEIYPAVVFSGPVKYRKIMFLKADGGNERVRLTDGRSCESAARAILASADLNTSLYENVLSDERLAAEVRLRELAVTRKVLSRLEEMEFVNTRRMDLGNLSGFAAGLRA